MSLLDDAWDLEAPPTPSAADTAATRSIHTDRRALLVCAALFLLLAAAAAVSPAPFLAAPAAVFGVLTGLHALERRPR